MNFTFAIAVAALAIEWICGYPSWLYEKIGHPISWIGGFIGSLDRNLNRDHDRPLQRRILGFLGLGTLLVVAVGSAQVASSTLSDSGKLGGIGFWLLAILASTLLAQNSLLAHVDAVARALEGKGIEDARIAVGQIVGRKVDTLDEAGVSRAAIESLFENFADGVVAPALWLGFLGLPGGAIYKAINTADSMIGHRTARFEAFGYAAAKLDDLVNLIPARLAALWLCLAAGITKGCSPKAAWRVMLRDSGGHPSPNAGWPEAAAAGALGLKLGGQRIYGTKLVDDAFIGDGNPDVGVKDIDLALKLYRRACAINGSAVALVFLLLSMRH